MKKIEWEVRVTFTPTKYNTMYDVENDIDKIMGKKSGGSGYSFSTGDRDLTYYIKLASAEEKKAAVDKKVRKLIKYLDQKGIKFGIESASECEMYWSKPIVKDRKKKK